MILEIEKFKNAIFVAEEKVPMDENIDRFLEYVNISELNRAAEEYVRDFLDEVEDADTCFFANKKIQKINTKKEAKEMMTNISTYYISKTNTMTKTHMCCPFCRSFSPIEKFLIPVDGWDVFMKKYATSFVAKFMAQSTLFGSRDMYVVPEQDIILSLNNVSNGAKIIKDEKGKGIPTMSYGVKTEDFFCNNEGVPKAVCPKCGKEIPMKKGRILTPKEPYKKYSIYRSGRWYNENSLDANMEIFTKGDLFTISLIRWHFYPNVHGKLYLEQSNVRMTLNTRTGQAYLFPEVDMKTKKPIKGCENVAKIRNVTYSQNCVPFSENVAKIALKKLCEYKGIEDMSDVVETNRYIDPNFLLYIVNRFGDYGKEFIRTYYYMYFMDSFTKKKRTELFKMLKNKEIFEDMIRKNGVKGKKKVKMFAANPILFMLEKYADMVGIKNPDIRLRLFENPSALVWLMEEVADTLNYPNVENDLSKFCNDFIKFKSESELANVLINNMKDGLLDCVRMYSRVIGIITSDNDRKKIFAGNYYQIHNKLMELANMIVEIPFYIPYTMSQLMYNCESGGYTFKLAQKSSDLKITGKKMHICVGSYSQRAFQHSCIIMIMYAPNGEPAACIELSPDMKELRQFKDYCNNPLSEEKREAAVSFLKKYKISFKECYDAANAEFSNVEGNCEVKRIADSSGYKIFRRKEDFCKCYVDVEEQKKNILEIATKKYSPKPHDDNPFDLPFI